MSELASIETEQSLDVFGNPRDSAYFEAVAIAVSLMHDALDTFGKRLDGLADSWELGLKARGIRLEEIPLATAAYVGGLNGSKFPTPGMFADWILEQRKWSMSQADLKAIGDRARQESEKRQAAFQARMISLYGNCERATVRAHLERLEAQTNRRIRIRRTKERPSVPYAVIEAELAQAGERRRLGQPYRDVTKEGTANEE